MAARDRNLFAWQAYVTIMSIVSFGLLIGVFFLWRVHADLLARYDETRTQLTTAQAEGNKSTMRVDRLKSMLGYGTFTADTIAFMRDSLKDDPEMSEIEKNYATDMTVFGPNVEKKDYRLFPSYLLDTIRERNEQIARARDTEQKLTAEKADVVARETKARELAVQEKEKAEKDLAATREQHLAQIAKLNAEKDQNQSMIAKYRQDLEAKNAVLENEKKSLLAQTKKQSDTITVQAEKIQELMRHDFEEPSGSVINVAEGSRTVWINIGSADGLREGVSFVVLEQSTLNVTEAKVKAEMIVEKVIEPHMATCRVTSPISTRPVLPGDLVYSPAWRKGRVTGFALVGLMDIDGDGRDDRDLIKSVIKSAGGEVDAEILPNGEEKTYSGMDVNTSYVVVGTDVVIGEEATKEQQDRAARYTRFIGNAKSLGIPQMSTNKLMGFLKSKNDTRTVPLGSQTRASDFEAQRPNGVTQESSGTVSDIFKQRRPAAR